MPCPADGNNIDADEQVGASYSQSPSGHHFEVVNARHMDCIYLGFISKKKCIGTR